MDTQEISRKEMIEKIKLHRSKLEAVLSRIPQEQFKVPIFTEGWTVKDILTHIVSWEQQMILWLGQASAGILPETPDSDQAVELINAEIYRENKDLPLEDVLQSFKQSYNQALSLAQEISEDVLFKQNLIKGRKDPYWITVAANTWGHYEEHCEDLKRWLEQQTPKTE